MWISKLYVIIIVFVIIIILHYVQFGFKYLNKIYDIENNYMLPMSCISNALCSMSGTILFFLIIYIIIPSETFETMIELLNPQKIHKISDHLKFNNDGSIITKKI